LLAAFATWAAFFSSSRFDQRIFDRIAPHISPGRNRFMSFLSFGGDTFFLIPANILLLLYFVYKKNKWWAIRVAVVSLSSVGLMSLLKNLIRRHRPSQPMVEGITNFSFPSGHAFMSVAFYGLLLLWAVICIKNKKLKQITVAFFIFLILVIGFTRIYLRMHFATDVIAGFGISTAWLILSLAIIDKIQARDLVDNK
jgi:membrane-associated phospholipid phosphatase